MNIKDVVKRILPAPVFMLVRSIPYQIIDLVRSPPAGETIPPLRMQLDGPRGYENYRAGGAQSFQFYLSEIGLRRDARILDIGCGVGRNTVRLTNYLNDDALYVGMDIEARSVKWCTRNISAIFPRFVFFTMDIYNKFYNPAGRIRPDKLVLPFPDDSFDVVSLWSVFTHMYPTDVQHYLEEARRVLKPGGKLVASYYLVNDHAKREMQAGTAIWAVTHYLTGHKCWTINPNIPEDLIGLEESWLRSAYVEAGLAIEAPVRLGGWANREVPAEFKDLNSQDIIIAKKPLAHA